MIKTLTLLLILQAAPASAQRAVGTPGGSAATVTSARGFARGVSSFVASESAAGPWRQTFPKGIMDLRNPLGAAVAFQLHRLGHSPAETAQAPDFDDRYKAALQAVKAALLASALEPAPKDRAEALLLREDMELALKPELASLFTPRETYYLEYTRSMVKRVHFGRVSMLGRRLIAAADSWLARGHADAVAANVLTVAAVSPRMAPAALTAPIARGIPMLGRARSELRAADLIGSSRRATILVEGARLPMRFVEPKYQAVDSVRYALEIDVKDGRQAWAAFRDLAIAHGRVRAPFVAPHTPHNTWTHHYRSGPLHGWVEGERIRIEFAEYPGRAEHPRDLEKKAAPAALFDAMRRHLDLRVDSAYSAPAPSAPPADYGGAPGPTLLGLGAMLSLPIAWAATTVAGAMLGLAVGWSLGRAAGGRSGPGRVADGWPGVAAALGPALLGAIVGGLLGAILLPGFVSSLASILSWLLAGA
ncbi:MAG: hypothetical protein HY553_05070 [Elusimicrobia bacterium]|nr:hypothetical protein [Elusimicrobiota bacterium]